MKKLITLLAVIGMFAFQGCTGPEGPPGPPGQDGLIAEVFELKNINFSYNATDGYNIYQKLTPAIYDSDVILIYRLSGTINSSTPIWQLIPRTLYVPQGELDYDFDFSKEDFTIFAGGTYNLSLTPQYLNNQTFRIVILPGSFSSTLNVSNYAEVMSALNFKENDIQKINF
ncbi:hypothetical protein [Flavobacterium nackdongense]|uniref:Collagen-like protein n=1 Tax=Flavobacterium nackdongense TaxID=2547394 RepID=A0A4V1AH30_9FLAO|nr:hypothetical protein [Flavobacterium nackdongense]QBN20112.1 hypothetical protein E1750_15330 [Flavobacterium nackdongense]